MASLDQIDKLDRMALDLEYILDHLDVDSRGCSACGRKHYNNWDEKQAADALQGALTRVEKARRILSNGTTSAQGSNT